MTPAGDRIRRERNSQVKRITTTCIVAGLSQSRFVNHRQLNLSQFQQAIATAKRRYVLIQKKHPSLRAFLVISLRGCQTHIESSLLQMIDEYPSLMPNSESKTRMLDFLKIPRPEKPTESEVKQWKAGFHELAEQLESHFHSPNGLEIIWQCGPKMIKTKGAGVGTSSAEANRPAK